MGPGGKDNEPAHPVILTQGFYLGKYEVTQKEYEKLIGINPSKFKGDNLPVEKVSWTGVVAFFEALNKEERIPKGWKFALPTEAEWEYACRAGTTTKFSWGDSITPQNANYQDSGFEKTVKVGSYRANPWGFFDMHGNAREWTADWYGAYPINPAVDPRGPNEGPGRVFRGGAWDYSGQGLLVSARDYNRPSARFNRFGIRVSLKQVD